ncbi:MAG: Smr/MutS family protein [Burkholderiales bacterium]|nr:Smr/MutS family protein [Burkholderiales bacterium]
MASARDLADLGALLRSERRATRRERRRAVATTTPAPTNPEVSDEPPAQRFGELFRAWRPYAAPSAEEVASFRAAMRDVTPLRARARAELQRTPPSPHPRQRALDERAALAASQAAENPSPMSWDIGADIEDEQSFLRAGVGPDVLRRLRRGEWTINAEIDLHAHNQDQAHAALGEFLRMARLGGWRCVRIIHGKGLGSHRRLPVLRNKVRRWLQQRDEVLAYCEPRPHGGGSGAVLVLLRGK